MKKFKVLKVLVFASLAVMLLASASCAPQPAATTAPEEPAASQPEQPTEQPAAAEPTIAVYAVPWPPYTDWDPAAEGSVGVSALHNIYETLLRWDTQKNEAVPVLATSL